MPWLEISVFLNLYSIIGILILSLSKTTITQFRLLSQKQRNYVTLYVLTIVFFWPFVFVTHYFVQEKVISKFF